MNEQQAPVTGAAGTPPPAATTPPPESWAHLRTLPLGDLCALAKAGYVRTFAAIETAKEKAAEKIHTHAKICGALQRGFVLAITNRSIPPTKFPAYHEANAGGKPSGRVMALANVFLTLVDRENPPLTEAQFDATPAEWLEKSSALLNTARETHGEAFMDAPEVKALVAAFTEPGDAGKKIAALRKAQKGEKPDAPATGEPSENGHFIEPSAFVEKWVRQSPDNLRAIIQLVGAELSGFTITNEVPRMVAAMQLAGELMESNPLFAAHFAAEMAKATPPPMKTADVSEVKTAPAKPAKPAKAAKPAALTSLADLSVAVLA